MLVELTEFFDCVEVSNTGWGNLEEISKLEPLVSTLIPISNNVSLEDFTKRPA